MKHRARQILMQFALLAFVLTQAIVPAGFMPSAVSEGVGFAYCPGDLKNTRLFQITEQTAQATSQSAHAHHLAQTRQTDHGAHAHHNVQDTAKQAISTNASDHCQFSLFSTPITFDFELMQLGVAVPIYRFFRLASTHAPNPHFFQPHSRAPPQKIRLV